MKNQTIGQSAAKQPYQVEGSETRQAVLRKWSRKYDCCVECGTSDLPHYGRGLCKRCYQQKWAIDKAEYLKSYKRYWYTEDKAKTDYRLRGDINKNGLLAPVLKATRVCARCGTDNDLTIHHKDHRGSNVSKALRNNDPDNEEVLCRSCHGREDATVKSWSRKWEKCRNCGTTEIPHHCHGYCDRCFFKF